jgi:hypothetical protein
MVLEVPTVRTESYDDVDFSLPEGPGPHPLVVLVHGGPIAPDRPVGPREWPVFTAYAALLAEAGVVGAMFEHPFRSDGDDALMYPALLALIERARNHPEVDLDRVVVWFFSAGGYFLGPLLADHPEWLTACAATYPYLGVAEEQLPTAAAACADGLPVPILLTTVEHEHDWCAETQADFLAAAPDVEQIHVADGHHGFEFLDDTDAARAAIRTAVTWVVDRVR